MLVALSQDPIERRRKQLAEQKHAAETQAAQLQQQLDQLPNGGEPQQHQGGAAGGGAGASRGQVEGPLRMPPKSRAQRRFDKEDAQIEGSGAELAEEDEPGREGNPRETYGRSTHMLSSVSTREDRGMAQAGAGGGSGAALGPFGKTCGLRLSGQECKGGTCSQKCKARRAGGEAVAAGCAPCCKLWRAKDPGNNVCGCTGTHKDPPPSNMAT